MLKDHATGQVLFRVETEVIRTSGNAADFDAFKTILESAPNPTPAQRKEMVGLLKKMVDGLQTKSADRGRAKEMFSSAFGNP
jgi:hypothetical protein